VARRAFAAKPPGAVHECGSTTAGKVAITGPPDAAAGMTRHQAPGLRQKIIKKIRRGKKIMSMSPPEKFRAYLAEPGFVAMPAVWDGLSAKLTSEAGFRCAFMSGSCVAASRLGGPDLDLLSFGEMFETFNMVHGAAPDLLVLADADHGYGNAMNVQRTVRAYGRAGAAAVLIEDKITPRALTAGGKPCLPRDEARMKVRAAVEAAKDSGIMVMARTDCRPTAGLDEALARIEMFVEEGADILFFDSPVDEEEIRRSVATAAGRPTFAVLSPGAIRATPTQARAAELGLKIGTFPTGLLSPATAGLIAGLAAIKAGDSAAATALPPPELATILGYADYEQKALRFRAEG
jgi:2-methylisocitrate lyase-like PEP mutase family enzyme